MSKENRIIIYSNCNIMEDYEDAARENLYARGVEDPTEDDLEAEISLLDAECWNTVKKELIEFFRKDCWLLRGRVQSWDGYHEAGTIFDNFNKILNVICNDSVFITIYDEGGHLYLEYSHHDGINYYEILKITEAGTQLIDEWEELNDTRTEQELHNTIAANFSELPRLAATLGHY